MRYLSGVMAMVSGGAACHWAFRDVPNYGSAAVFTIAAVAFIVAACTKS